MQGLGFTSLSPGGGIGRRAWLRAMCPQGRVGSSPTLGTMIKLNVFFAIICTACVAGHWVFLRVWFEWITTRHQTLTLGGFSTLVHNLREKIGMHDFTCRVHNGT